MTELLYLNDHYLKVFDATIVEFPSPNSIVLDRTAFYPKGGGQPSDHGFLEGDRGTVRVEVIDSVKEPQRVAHVLSATLGDRVKSDLAGKKLHGVVDWELRYKHMRHHTALHILSGIVYHRFDSKITGGQIYHDRARLDFTLADLSRDRLSLIESEVNKIVWDNNEVRTFWLDADEARAKSELYRLNADLLPKGLEKLRIVEIAGFDAQLDGGTHVARTGEVGRVRISKTENKGRENKRIEVVLDQVTHPLAH